MKKVLTLTVNKEWFSRILSGEKKEEYRDQTLLGCSSLL